MMALDEKFMENQHYCNSFEKVFMFVQHVMQPQRIFLKAFYKENLNKEPKEKYHQKY